MLDSTLLCANRDAHTHDETNDLNMNYKETSCKQKLIHPIRRHLQHERIAGPPHPRASKQTNKQTEPTELFHLSSRESELESKLES